MPAEIEGSRYELEEQPWGSAPWLFRVAMEEGESLSSFFSRQARLNEMKLAEAMRLLGWFGGIPFRMDLDVQPDERVLRAASMAFGIPVEGLRAGTLGTILKVVVSPTIRASHLGHNWRSRHLSWVLPKSWLYGKGVVGPTRGGIPYCPICFAESRDPWFPITHRISLILTCGRHGVWLRDDCPRCGHPVGPMALIANGDWSQSKPGPLCIYCQFRYQGNREPAQVDRVEYADEPQLEFQQLIRAALRGEPIQLKGIGPLTAAQFLGGMSFIKTVVNYLSDQGLNPPTLDGASEPSNQAEVKRSSSQPSLEFISIAERRRRLEWFQWACERPLDRWHVMRRNVKGVIHITKTKSHPWEGVAPDGEFLKSCTWQYGRQQRTQQARLDEVTGFFHVAQYLGMNDREVRDLLGGGISTRECLIWRNLPSRRVPTECRHRMGHFMRIWSTAVEAGGNDEAAKLLLTQSSGHSRLNGLSPMQFLSGDQTGNALEQVSDWVSSAVGPGESDQIRGDSP